MNILDVGIPAHALLSTTHSDALAASVTRGALIVGNATPAWALLTIGSAGKVLQSDGTDVAWATPTGTGLPVLQTSPTIVTPTVASFVNATHSHLDAAGGGTITAAAVSDLNSATVTFTNKSGNISQWTNDTGYLTSVSAHNLLSATHGDTLADSVVRGDIIYGNATPKWARLAKPSVLSGLSHDGTDVSWVTATGTGAPVRGTAPTFASSITIGTASSATGTALFKGTTSGTVTLSVADAAGTWTMKLPTTAGTNLYFLQTDGSGNTTWAAGGGGITIGTTAITSGTSGRVLYDNAGVVGEMTTTGSGTVLVLATAPTITGPAVISEAVGSSGLTITGATQTSSFPALSITQTWNAAGVTMTGVKINITNTASTSGSPMFDVQLGGTSKLKVGTDGYTYATGLRLSGGDAQNTVYQGSGNLGIGAASGNKVGFYNGAFVFYVSITSGDSNIGGRRNLTWGANDSTPDAYLQGVAAATFQLGQDVNGTAVSQTLQVANGITGTDKPGGSVTIAAGKGTGASIPGVINFDTATAVASGTTAQTRTTRFTIATGLLTVADATDFAFNATTGTKHGTATSQKQSFWNATPIVQPTTGIAAATFVANTSGTVNDTATWDSYTIGQVVKALRNVGLLA